MQNPYRPGPDTGIDDDLPTSARLLLRILKDHCREKSYCWPSQELLAAHVGVSVKQIQRLLQMLVDRKYLEMFRPNRQKTIRYVFPEATWVSPRDTTPMSPREVPMSPRDTTPMSPREASALIDEFDELEIEENSSSAAAGSAAPLETKTPPPVEQTIAELVDLGMPESGKPIARRFPDLARAVLSHCEARFTHPKLKTVQNQPGYVLACLREPHKFGITRDATGAWSEPPPPESAARSRSRASKEATRRLLEASAAAEAESKMEEYSAEIRAWDALPEERRAAIREHVRTRRPLFATMGDDSWVFRSACIRVMLGGLL